MLVTEVKYTEETIQEKEYRELYAIEIDGKNVFSCWDGESEDNRISRNFKGVFKITSIIEMAYEAGKNNEKLEFQIREIEEY